MPIKYFAGIACLLLLTTITRAQQTDSLPGNTPKPRFNDIFHFVEEPPAFPGGPTRLEYFVLENLRYPEDARLKGMSGTIFVSFIIDSTGQLWDVQVVQNVIGPELAAEAIRVVKAMPPWIPGKQNGRNVNVYQFLPIHFALPHYMTSLRYKGRNKPPAFPGGPKAMQRFLKENLHYPEAARKNNMSGIVVMSVIVREDGTLLNIRPLGKRRGYGMEEEAIRIVSMMPTWKPGIWNGVNTPLEVSFSVAFNLDEHIK